METIQRTISPEHYTQIVDEAGRALRQGQIVAMPTETVYGLGANQADPMAMERLIRLKNRPPGKPFTLHLSDRSEIFRYAPGTHRFAHLLISRYWPGPLTIVVTALSGEPMGFRVPGFDLTRDIIRAAGVPVVLPSANPAGVNPACTAAEVSAFYSGEIDLIVDSGKTKIGDPSTVVKITENSLAVIRAGIISTEDIFNTACHQILFVCTGNTCRSPMAEGICKKLLAEKLGCAIEELPNRGYIVGSAGISTLLGEQASRNAYKALDKWKIDLSSHRTTPLTRRLIEATDRIYVMTSAHQAVVESERKQGGSRIEHLDRKGRDILDPFGGSESVYSRCASQIYANILEIVEKL